MKTIIFLFLFCLTCKTKDKTHINELEGQKWIFEDNRIGIGKGKSWSFLSNNRFDATYWYSGGGYYTHKSSGSFYYNTHSKTVYLKYDRNPLLKEGDFLIPNSYYYSKISIQLKIRNKDTIPIINKGWKKINKDTTSTESYLKISKSLNIFEKSSFRIEYIKK